MNKYKKTIHCKSPKIFTIDDFISKSDCQHFITLSKNKLKKAGVAGDSKSIQSLGRTNKNCWVKHDNDNITLKTVKKIADLIGFPPSHAESFQIIHYSKGQKYEYHYDGFPVDDSVKSKTYLKKGGQRMVTALVYLNDVEEGGGTGFCKLKLEVEPKMGRIVVFESFNQGTNTMNPKSLHSGRPVIKGEKWAFNLWFREIPATENYFED